MEGEKMIESLDSVWFFSNVLSSKKVQPFATFDADEDEMVTHKLGQSKPIIQILETESLDSVWLFSNIFSPKKIQSFGEFHGVEDDLMNPKLEEPKPMSQVPEIHQAHNSSTDENLKPTFGNSEPRAQILQAQFPRTILGELGCEAKRNRSKNIVKKKKKKRKNSYEKMKKSDDGEINWGGFDFGLGLIDDADEFRMMMKGFDEENKRFTTSQNLPPLSDGLAMKQHLKSWAYAVACNVR